MIRIESARRRTSTASWKPPNVSPSLSGARPQAAIAPSRLDCREPPADVERRAMALEIKPLELTFAGRVRAD
jgi:hypothetical protein